MDSKVAVMACKVLKQDPQVQEHPQIVHHTFNDAKSVAVGSIKPYNTQSY